MSSVAYDNYKSLALKGSIALLTDTIKLALLTSSYTPAIKTDTFLSDINTNEVSGAGYTAGGVAITTPTVTTDTTNDRGVFGAANTTFSSVTFSGARYAVIYKSTGVASTSPLIAVIDLGSNQSAAGGNFTIQWNASGIFYLG